MEFLHPAIWHDRDIDFTRWPCSVACGCGIMTLNSPGGSTLQCGRRLWVDMPLNSPERPPYWNSTSGFDFDHITAVDMSFCTSLQNFIQMSAILDFRRPIMGSLKSPCFVRLPIGVSGHRMSKLLSFWENCGFFAFWRQTNRWTAPMH